MEQKIKDFLKTKNGKMIVGVVIGLAAIVLIVLKKKGHKRSIRNAFK